MYHGMRSAALAMLWALAFSIAAPALSFAQEGCYFGVCPGDEGTEFPDEPTARLPLPSPPQSPPQQTPPTGQLPTEVPGMTPERLAELCRAAFWVGGDHTWYVRMGLNNALAICEAALRDNPNDWELQLAYAMARDIYADNDGTPADNYYAVEAYRDLAASGSGPARFALATMYNEDAGVSIEEARGYFAKAASGAWGNGIACAAIKDYVAYEERPLTVTEIAKLEERASNSAMCADRIVAWYSRSDFEPNANFPYIDYVRIAAVHGSHLAAFELGKFYGRGPTWDWPDRYAHLVTVDRDLERGGYWLLIADAAQRLYLNTPIFGASVSGDNATAVQTALRSLGYYNGAIDGDFGPLSRQALEAFLASDDVDPLFQRLRTSEPGLPLTPEMIDMHIGRAALQ